MTAVGTRTVLLPRVEPWKSVLLTAWHEDIQYANRLDESMLRRLFSDDL